ncbi:MAG: hypothetical protein MOB07_10710 [Acidobacteria bacterium]|nr:hypothetical protein [Acidobacteriota bacterium]
MKNAFWRAGLALLFLPLVAVAQEAPKAELFTGYSYLRPEGVNGHGFNGSIAGNINKHFGLVADIGVYRISDFGESATGVTYLFGPRISGRSERVNPFIHALFGGARVSDDFGGTNAFAFALGGGLDIKASDSVAFRIAQVDYLGVITSYPERLGHAANHKRQQLRSAQIGAQQPRIIIDAPIGGSAGRSVTFQWRLQGGPPSETYRLSR